MAKSVDVYIGEKLKEVREKLNLTQNELAGATGYSQPAVARFELNKVPTPLCLVKVIERDLNEPELLEIWLDKVHEIAMKPLGGC
jgi:transcriptional regulator with XRE-family HTH domain